MTTALSNGMRVNLRFQYGTDKRGRRTTSAIVETNGQQQVAILGSASVHPVVFFGDSQTESGPPRVLIYSGSTACSKNDRFTRAEGRLHALKALFARHADIHHADRVAIWSCYWNRKHAKAEKAVKDPDVKMWNESCKRVAESR